MKTIITLLAMLGVFATSAQQKQGAIKGTVKDDIGESVPFVNVILLQLDSVILVTTTNFDGNYVLKPIPQGEYDVKFSFVGYQTNTITYIPVKIDTSTVVNIAILIGFELGEVEEVYSTPIFIGNEDLNWTNKSRREIEQCRLHSPTDIAKITGEEITTRNDSSFTIRCGRPGTSVTFIDGLRVVGPNLLSLNRCVKEVLVQFKGTSAQYENKEKRNSLTGDFINK